MKHFNGNEHKSDVICRNVRIFFGSIILLLINMIIWKIYQHEFEIIEANLYFFFVKLR